MCLPLKSAGVGMRWSYSIPQRAMSALGHKQIRRSLERCPLFSRKRGQATKFASRQRAHFPSDCLRKIESVYPLRCMGVPSGGMTVISM